MLKLVSGIAVVFIVASLWYVSPILKPFPQPTGLYSIGTQSLYFVDEHRAEEYSSDTEKRAVVVRLWYPSTVDQGARYPYFGNKMPLLQKMLAGFYNIPCWASSLVWRGIMTHAYSDAPLALTHATYSVVLFSHGLLGTPCDAYVGIIENLVSHGYIVAAIDHPYLNILTQYSDGRVVSSSKLDAQFEKMSQQEQREFQSKVIDTYKADMKFVIDQLEQLNNDAHTIFYHRLDLSKMGAMGHSAGGTASIEFCRSDMRCKLAADLDGWYDHIIGNEPLDKPLLLLFGSKSVEVAEPTPEYLKRKEITRQQYFEREEKIAEDKKELCKKPLCSIVIIPGVSHGDFSDEILLKWPLRVWSAADSYKALAMINDYLVKFLDAHLKQGE